MRSFGSPSAQPLTPPQNSVSGCNISLTLGSTSSSTGAASPPPGSIASHSPSHPPSSVAAPSPSSVISLSPSSAASPSPDITGTEPATTSSTATTPLATVTPSATVTSPQSPDADALHGPIVSASPNAVNTPAPHRTLAVLLAENEALRRQVSDLKHQVKLILDHSIESDTRLLAFTDEVFTNPTTTKRTAHCDTIPTTVDNSVQCELPDICQNEQCTESRTLVLNLKTTVEVLEAELQCFKNDSRICACGGRLESCGGWSVYRTKSAPVKLNNRYGILPADEYEVERPVTQKTNTSRQNNKNDNNKPKKHRLITPKNNARSHKKFPTEAGKTKMSFRGVTIESDSHGRHLAGIIQELVDSTTSVVGFVKPGAKLLNVTSRHAPTPHSCTVLIAGTNDLAEGQQSNVYRHMEQCILAKIGSSRMVVSTLPHRHDLPVHHPVNKNTELVNGHIKAITSKYEGVEVVDFNRIGRRLFTRHGMHLRMPGKRLLARLVLESILKVDIDSTTTAPRVNLSSTQSDSEPTSGRGPWSTGPVTLLYDTFADAVKKKSSRFSAIQSTRSIQGQESSAGEVLQQPTLSPQSQTTAFTPPSLHRTPTDNRQTDVNYKNPSGQCFLGTPAYSSGLK